MAQAEPTEAQKILDWSRSEGHYAVHWAPNMVFFCAKDCAGGTVVSTLGNAKAYALLQAQPRESFLSKQLRLYEEGERKSA